MRQWNENCKPPKSKNADMEHDVFPIYSNSPQAEEVYSVDIESYMANINSKLASLVKITERSMKDHDARLKKIEMMLSTGQQKKFNIDEPVKKKININNDVKVFEMNSLSVVELSENIEAASGEVPLVVYTSKSPDHIDLFIYPLTSEECKEMYDTYGEAMKESLSNGCAMPLACFESFMNLRISKNNEIHGSAHCDTAICMQMSDARTVKTEDSKIVITRKPNSGAPGITVISSKSYRYQLIVRPSHIQP